MTRDAVDREQDQQWIGGGHDPAAGSPHAAAIHRKLRICAQCRTIGRPKSVAPGSFLVEVILWLCLLVPGLIYSLWRISAKQPTCRTCGAIRSLVPLSSPAGRQLAARITR